MDLGRVGTVRFGTVLASGFDSRVNDRGNRMRWPSGRLQLRPGDDRRVGRLRPVPYRITAGRRPGPGDRGHPDRCGQRPLLRRRHADLRGRRLDDGLFDITVVGDCSRSTLLTRISASLSRAPISSHPIVTVHRAAAIALAADGLTGYADGEPLGPLPLTAHSVPAAVRVLGGPSH